MTGFADKVPLGRTGLMVSRMGVGSSYGPSSRACRTAFDAGVNYFFWGSVRTRAMAFAIREIARQQRDDIVIVLESYARSGFMLRKSVENGLKKLRIDQADILLLGWHDRPPSMRVLDAADKLREQGRFRHLAISSHQRPLYPGFVASGRYDVFHLRYNAAHPGAEVDIFPQLPDVGGPGIVSFTCLRWGTLLEARNMPDGMTPPTAAECYRFVLSNPNVHVAITGPKNEREMDTALSVLDSGPMDSEELERMREIGAHVHEIRSLMAALT